MTRLNIDKACAADVLFSDMVWTDDESLSDFIVGDEAVQSQLVITSSSAPRFLD